MSPHLDLEPPRWFSIAGWVFSLVSSLGVALNIMLQWAVWMMLSMQLWRPWGVGIAIVVCASQLLMLFDTKRPKTACPIDG